MENEKTTKGFIIGAVILGIFLVLIFVFVVVINNINTTEEINQTNITYNLYLSAVDGSGVQQKANYLILWNNTKLSDGELSEDSLTEIKINKKDNIEIYCWGNGYYLSGFEESLNDREISDGSTKQICNLREVGDLEINHTGEITRDERNIIRINLRTKKNFNHLSAVISWTNGILNYKIRETEVSCKDGWKNYTDYDEETKIYEWIKEKGKYKCGEDFEFCKEINKNGLCVVEDEEIPRRYGNGVDRAFYSGKSLHNEEYTITLEVETIEDIKEGDYLELIFYDKDFRYVAGEFQIFSERVGDVIGNDREFVYRLDFQDI